MHPPPPPCSPSSSVENRLQIEQSTAYEPQVGNLYSFCLEKGLDAIWHKRRCYALGSVLLNGIGLGVLAFVQLICPSQPRL